jgi:Domain of unknown function (DUF4352)
MHQQPPGPQRPYAQQPPDISWQPYPPQGLYQPQAPYPPRGPDPTYGYLPRPPYQPPPRKSWPRRHKVLTALLAFVGLVVIIGIGSAIGSGGGADNNTNAASGGGGQQAAAPAGGPHIGQPAADGKFRFVITRVTYRKSVGDTSLGLGETAQGRYTVLHIKVTNISNQSQTLDDSTQYVYDARGRKFDADTQADIDGNPGNNGGVFLNDINPGNTVRGLLFFDLPRGDTAVKAELHDSMFSDGVTVDLTH